jgi:putative phage-type endonuclease
MLTEVQRTFRASGIGSSDIAALCGEDPMKSALDVWLDKIGRGVPFAQNDQADLGHLLEPVIADRFARRHAVEIESLTTMAHPEVPFALATPDRWIRGSRELIETKNVGYRMMRRWRALSGEYVVPPYVQLQGQWQCFVTGSRAFWVVALLGGRDFVEERFDADEEIADGLVSIAREFWSVNVEQGVEPEPDASEAAKRVLERLYPRATVALVEPTSDIRLWAEAYADARASEKAAAAKKALAANHLRQLLGDSIGTDEADWGHVEWKEKKGRTNWKAVAAELGATKDAIAKHSGSPSRSLRVIWNGSDDEDEEG